MQKHKSYPHIKLILVLDQISISRYQSSSLFALFYLLLQEVTSVGYYASSEILGTEKKSQLLKEKRTELLDAHLVDPAHPSGNRQILCFDLEEYLSQFVF